MKLESYSWIAATLAFVLNACGDDAGGGGSSKGGQDAVASNSVASVGSTTATTGTSTGTGGSGGGGPDLTSKPNCTTEPSGSPTPLARADAGAAFAPDGLSVVMFGGDTATVVCGQPPARQHVGETWLLDPACGGWTELPAAGGPSARARHVMVADPARGRALLFGGRTRAGAAGPYTLFNDVWAFDFASKTWAEVSTTGPAPSKRSNAGAALAGNTLYVFGGSDSTSALAFAPKNDLFALDLATNTWSQIMATGAPPARLFHAMSADAAGQKLYVLGGGDENAFLGPFFQDLWELDVAAKAWTKSSVSFSAVVDPARIKAGLLAEPANGGTRLHFFGGHDDGELGNRNDTNVLDVGGAAFRAARPGDTFNKPSNAMCDFPSDFTVVDKASPERRSGFALALHPDSKAMVVIAGDTDCGRASDSWWYDAVKEQWEIIRATPVGLTCQRFSDQCTGLCG